MKRTMGYRILLGGLGGDSHSVGLHTLHRALVAQGYRVEFLGTQNTLEDFTRRASGFDVVIISNMDGHAEHYLKDFRPPAVVSGRHALWFLGGNLTVGDAAGYQDRFERQGFDRVFVKFVDLSTVLDCLAQSLQGLEPVSLSSAERRDEQFFRNREEVLAAWPTGRAVASLEDNAAFLGEQPSFPRLLAETEAGLRPMVVRPRSGVPGVDEQIALFRRFRAAGAMGPEGFTGRNRDYLLVESDVLRVPRELYQAWPLDAVTTDPTFASLPTETGPAVYALPGAG